ncbi:MAG: hypothetical protein LBM04_08195 [Opitutaceae bacterium]|jgi:O-glycosyl hydrolase|nr:hypothetical protein [Opitutaceae bacterium]
MIFTRWYVLPVIFMVAAGAVAARQAPVVTVAETPAQQMAYGMDFERLWSWDTLKPAEQKRHAEAAVRECRVQYARVAVRAAAEPREGVFQPEAYDQILDMMTHLKAARPDLAFFGSPRPISTEQKDMPYTCFPMWITEFESIQKEGKRKWVYKKFQAEKAADYMARYVRFMKTKGFSITYLDLKNEVDRLVTPRQAGIMAGRLRQQLGVETPLLIAPSSFDYNGAKAWVGAAMKGRDAGDIFFDIVSTHNTAEKGSLEEVATLARKLGKPLWNTELHGWTGPDEDAAVNTAVLLGQIRAGVGGVSDWLSLGNEKKTFKMFRALKDGSLAIMRIYYIYKQLVNTSGEGRYVPTTIPDGLRSTAAFLRGRQMTVWLLNAEPTPLKNVTVNLGKRVIEGTQIKTMWWGPDNPREGSMGKLDARSRSPEFTCDLPARTLICLEFEIEREK